jgi:hypothetical protein
MSVTPALRASARSAYRDLLRASASTFLGKSSWFLQRNHSTISSPFVGDEPLQRGLYIVEDHKFKTYESVSGFRLKMRTETLFLNTLAQDDVKLVQEKIQLARQLATTLRKNVVQARRTQTKEGQDAWSMSPVIVLLKSLIRVYRSPVHRGH